MKTKIRFVDVLSPRVNVLEGAEGVLFEDILKFMENREYILGEKSFKFSLFSNPTHEHYLEGMVITTQDSDIPPKRNKRTGAFSSVDIDTREEGFAYANVFLYDTVRKVFVYEINKNGCFPRQLIEAIYACWNRPTIEEGDSSRTRFNLSFPVFARRDEYNRMLRMSYYQKLSVELVNPQGIIFSEMEENDSMKNWIKATIDKAAGFNANVIRLEQTALSRKINPNGLSHDCVKDIVDKVKSMFGIGNIQKLEVQGYSEDVEDSRRCRPVDLLTDAFKESFKIEDIQVNSDLQTRARKEGIEGLYNRILPEIIQIVGQEG